MTTTIAEYRVRLSPALMRRVVKAAERRGAIKPSRAKMIEFLLDEALKRDEKKS